MNNTQKNSIAGLGEEERVISLLKDAPLVRLLQHHATETGNKMLSFSQFKLKPLKAAHQ